MSLAGRAALTCLALAVFAGCGQEDRAAPAPTEPHEPAPPQTAPQAGLGDVADQIAVLVRAVDREGRPVAGAVPVATRSANMLEPEPVAQGEPTGPEGNGRVLVSRGERVFVRTLDPGKDRFPNNFLEIRPGAGAQTERREIVMVKKAQLVAKMLDADGFPIAGADVALMLFHPSAGPWWPDEAWTDEDGVVRFEALPPGVYRVKLKTEAGGLLELPRVELPPGGLINLGPLAPPEAPEEKPRQTRET